MIIATTKQGFAIGRLRVQRTREDDEALHRFEGAGALLNGSVEDTVLSASSVAHGPRTKGRAHVMLEVQGLGSISKLAAKLANLEGVISVNAGNEASE